MKVVLHDSSELEFRTARRLEAARAIGPKRREAVLIRQTGGQDCAADADGHRSDHDDASPKDPDGSRCCAIRGDSSPKQCPP